MPIKELLVVICMMVTALALTFTGNQLYVIYMSSIPGALPAGYHMDNNGIMRSGMPPLNAMNEEQYDIPLAPAQPIEIDVNMMKITD